MKCHRKCGKKKLKLHGSGNNVVSKNDGVVRYTHRQIIEKIVRKYTDRHIQCNVMHSMIEKLIDKQN